MGKTPSSIRLYLESCQRTLLGTGLILLLQSTTLFSTTLLPDESILPELTHRQTQKARLSNDLEVYLISDPKAERSSIALSIQAGSWDDPPSAPGMAHFLEHMLFLGTEKYPDEASHDRFIKQHGGRGNAFTEDQFTTYLYQIDSDAFENSLDRFAQFFTSPLFNPSGVTREMQAIRQEFEGKRHDDEVRRLLVYKELANPNHPWHQFSIGNDETLESVTQEQLHAWFENHYSANLMHLVIYSPHSLDQQLKWAETYFNQIPNRNLIPYSTNEPMTTEDLKNHIVFIEPVEDKNVLTLYWELPSALSFQMETQPDTVVSHLLGNEDHGSLLAQLKREGLANGLAATSARWHRDQTIFFIQIELTKKGVKEPYAIVKRCFEAIAYYRYHPLPLYVFNDLNQLSTIRYQFQQRLDPFDEVMKHARTMRNESLETYPMQSTIIKKNDPAQVKELLDYLNPTQCHIYLTAKTKHTKITQPDFIEKWMKIPYAIRAVPKDMLEEWETAKPHVAIRHPEPNPFIPTDLQLKHPLKEISYHPQLLVDNDQGKLYFAPDTYYQTPSSYISIQLASPAIAPNDPRSLVLCDLYMEALKEAINEQLYPALVAGLTYEIKRVDEHLLIQLYGWNDKMPDLLEEILEHLKNPTISQTRLLQLKDSLKRTYNNFAHANAYKRGLDILRDVIYNQYCREKDKARAIASIEESDFNNYLAEFFSKNYTKMLVFGNLTATESEALWNQLQKSLSSVPYALSEQNKVEIASFSADKGPFYLDCRLKTNANALILALEQEPHAFDKQAAGQIAAQLISQPFFSTLRTKQQTAYIVANDQQEIKHKVLQLFLVESHSHDPRDLLARTEQVIESFLHDIQYDQKFKNRFETAKEILAQQLNAPPENLQRMGELLATLAFEYDGDFDWQKKRIQGFKDLSYDQFLNEIQDLYGKENRKRLAILVRNSTQSGILQYNRARGIKWLREKSGDLIW